MSDTQVGMAVLCLIAIVLIVVFVSCHSLDLLSYISAWIYSTKEEKIGLTRSKGHYNANGYLIHSDSDIHLSTTGSFRRFDSIDKDFKMTIASTSFSEGWSCIEIDHTKPLQNLPPSLQIPAPTPITIKNTLTEQLDSCETYNTTTSISSILRPVSSINVYKLATNSEFPNVCPPPSSVSTRPETNHFHEVQAEDTEIISGALKRAISCESVCSDSSVVLVDLQEPNVTGYLCVGLEYDSESCDFVVNVLEAKDLIGPVNEEQLLSSYVRVFLLPDKATAIQTKVYRSTKSPSYKERFLFHLELRQQTYKSLCFHVYCIDNLSHLLIGEGEIRLNDVSLRQPVTTWVTLTDTGQQVTEFGEIMFSLSYLPTAERLTVVVVKARKLKFQNEIGDSFVKVYLLHHGKKIYKKRTSVKKTERCPIFNESMMFSVPAHTLQTIQLRLTVSEVSRTDPSAKSFSIGHVIVGAQATGRSLCHWNQMLTTLRKPVAMWHLLRK